MGGGPRGRMMGAGPRGWVMGGVPRLEGAPSRALTWVWGLWRRPELRNFLDRLAAVTRHRRAPTGPASRRRTGGRFLRPAGSPRPHGEGLRGGVGSCPPLCVPPRAYPPRQNRDAPSASAAPGRSPLRAGGCPQPPPPPPASAFHVGSGTAGGLAADLLLRRACRTHEPPCRPYTGRPLPADWEGAKGD